jgi:signal transduction histidine kinase
MNYRHHFHAGNFADVMKHALLIRLVRAMQKNLSLTHQVAEDVPTILLGDDGRLRQILINLVGNAIKFTDRGEIIVRVRIESRALDKTTLHFEIHESGIGISPEVQGRIFDAFTQAETNTNRRYGGTGLGLFICKELCEANRARLYYQRTTDGRSAFRLAFPHQDRPFF